MITIKQDTLSSWRRVLSNTMLPSVKRIFIIPIGSTDPSILKTISASLEKTFHCMIETGTEMPIPLTSYDSRRNQYCTTTILKTLRDITRRDGDRVLGVADADLFVPGLNFVFGEADSSVGVAVTIPLGYFSITIYNRPFRDTSHAGCRHTLLTSFAIIKVSAV
jgi:hypothetical protein